MVRKISLILLPVLLLAACGEHKTPTAPATPAVAPAAQLPAPPVAPPPISAGGVNQDMAGAAMEGSACTESCDGGKKLDIQCPSGQIAVCDCETQSTRCDGQDPPPAQQSPNR